MAAAGTALLLIAAVVAISLASAGTSQAQVFRTPVGDPGRNAYMGPAIHTGATAGGSATSPTSAGAGLGALVSKFLHPPADALTLPPGAPPKSQPTFSGATPGLYGGTQQLTVCDAQQMVDFLAANPDKARAWAAVEGIGLADIPSYLAGLTDVVLRTDTQVINHGFINGQATTIPEVLEAGTAVLIDKFGVPRARCFCGNPLLPPKPLKGKVTFTGPTWEGFTPSQVAAILPGSEITKVVLVDLATGAPFVRPVGTDGSEDAPAPEDVLANSPFNPAAGANPFTPPTATTVAPTTTPVTTVAPTTTVPPTTARPTTTLAPAVNVATRGSATASSDTGGLYPASLAVDGDPTTSWFSSGSNHDGPVTTYTWTGPQNFHISSIAIIGNENNSIVAFRNGFGYASSEIQVFNSAGTMTYDQKFAGPGPASTDVHATVNATDQTVKVLLSGGQAADCGGFAELQIMGSPA